MPSITLHCPNCQQAYQMSPEQIAKYAGRTITCRKCKQPFAFDAAMDAAAQAAGQTDAAHEPAGATESSDAGAAAYGAPPAPPPAAPAYDAGQAAYSAGGYDTTGSGTAGYNTAPPGPPPPAFQQYAPPPPAAAVNYATPDPGRPKWSWGGFFAFRIMMTPIIIQILFWVGVGLSVLFGLVSLIGAIASFDRLGVAGLLPLLIALISLVLGPIFVRIYCELLILLFRIYETLQEIRHSLDRRP